MGDLAAVAERLRLVRRARRKFLRLWAIDQALVEPLLDRVQADIASDPDDPTGPPLQAPDPRTDKG